MPRYSKRHRNPAMCEHLVYFDRRLECSHCDLKMVDQAEIDILFRRMERLDNASSSSTSRDYTKDVMTVLHGRLLNGYDSWESIAKDALKELEKYR